MAVGAVSQLLAERTHLYFRLQNISWFWKVATRPKDRNGLSLTIPSELTEVGKIESLLMLQLDTPGVYAAWKGIIVIISCAALCLSRSTANGQVIVFGIFRSARVVGGANSAKSLQEFSANVPIRAVVAQLS